MILQKAMNLRTKRNTAAKKAEAQRLRQEKIKQNYLFVLITHSFSFSLLRCREHVAKMKVIENQKNAIREERFSRLVQMHEAESKYWITMENIDKKITRELFETPATTGVTTEISEYWRYCCPSMQPNRTLARLLEADDDDAEDSDDELMKKYDESERDVFMSPIDYYLNNEEQITTQKESIRGMLNAMIGEGSDRAKYESLVSEFVELTETLNGPMGEIHPMKKFGSEDLPKSKKVVTPEELMDLIDQSVSSPLPPYLSLLPLVSSPQ
jgi:hypothetical protein